MMSGNADSYSVDPDELDQVISDLEALEAELSSATDDLARQMARLHETWEGLSAVAQREAHQEWEHGMVAMRGALGELRAAARTAHSNYGVATGANVSMWEGLA